MSSIYGVVTLTIRHEIKSRVVKLRRTRRARHENDTADFSEADLNKAEEKKRWLTE